MGGKRKGQAVRGAARPEALTAGALIVAAVAAEEAPVAERLYEPLPVARSYGEATGVDTLRLARCTDGSLALYGWGYDGPCRWAFPAGVARLLMEHLREALGGAAARGSEGAWERGSDAAEEARLDADLWVAVGHDSRLSRVEARVGALELEVSALVEPLSQEGAAGAGGVPES